jgi:hypothetical protein
MGRFKESAEAYIQALKLKPTDGDAKHNLELALKKLKQQRLRPIPIRENQIRTSPAGNRPPPATPAKRRSRTNRPPPEIGINRTGVTISNAAGSPARRIH